MLAVRVLPSALFHALAGGIPGWLLGKAMVERRGFFWAWLIHFLQDVLIFAFRAAGSVTPGG